MKNAPSSSYYYYLTGRRIISVLGHAIFSSGKTKQRTAYFNASLAEYVNLNNYINLSFNADSLNSAYANIEISADTLGHDNKDIILQYGAPDFIFTDNKLKIFVYSRLLNKLKIRYEIHFYANKVFLLNQTYRHIDVEDKKYLIKSTLGKYLVKDANILHWKAIDSYNNITFITDYLLGLKISFLSNKESGWFAGMKSEIEAEIKLGAKGGHYA
jgi:hypothetical protein